MESETSITTQPVTHGKLRKWTFRILKVLGNVLFALLMVLVLFMLFFMIRSKATGGAPEIAGHYMFVVLSGSMSPKFDTGSVAFVKSVKAAEITKGDIITFKGFAGSDKLTTHRVIAINQKADGPEFITKGDANRSSDPDPIPGNNLVGRVSFTIPYLGYFINFAQTKYGLLCLIVVPGILLVLSECRSLYKNYASSKKKEQEETTEPEIAVQTVGKEEQ